MDNKQSGLKPISAEDLDNFYGCSGHGISCPDAGKESGYNSNCCWHDCRKGDSSIGTKLWTAWS